MNDKDLVFFNWIVLCVDSSIGIWFWNKRHRLSNCIWVAFDIYCTDTSLKIWCAKLLWCVVGSVWKQEIEMNKQKKKRTHEQFKLFANEMEWYHSNAMAFDPIFRSKIPRTDKLWQAHKFSPHRQQITHTHTHTPADTNATWIHKLANAFSEFITVANSNGSFDSFCLHQRAIAIHNMKAQFKRIVPKNAEQRATFIKSRDIFTSLCSSYVTQLLVLFKTKTETIDQKREQKQWETEVKKKETDFDGNKKFTNTHLNSQADTVSFWFFFFVCFFFGLKFDHISNNSHTQFHTPKLFHHFNAFNSIQTTWNDFERLLSNFARNEYWVNSGECAFTVITRMKQSHTVYLAPKSSTVCERK